MENPFENPFITTPNPKLYLADIIIQYALKGKGIMVKGKTIDIMAFKKICDYPITLLQNKPPTRVSEAKAISKLESYISTGFKEGSVKIYKIENIRFSSELSYKFDFNIH